MNRKCKQIIISRMIWEHFLDRKQNAINQTIWEHISNRKEQIIKHTKWKEHIVWPKNRSFKCDEVPIQMRVKTLALNW